MRHHDPRTPAPKHGDGLLARARRNFQPILGVVISGAALWIFVHDLNLERIAAQLQYADWGLLALCLLSVPASMVFKAVRWRYLFGPGTSPPFYPLLSSLYIGYMMNTILPARVGELVRAYLIGRQERVSTAAGLATIVLEKLLDLAVLALLLIGLVVAQGQGLPEWVTPYAWTSAAALTLGLVALGLLLAVRRQVVTLVGWLEGRSSLVKRLQPTALAATFLDGLAGVGRRETLPGLLLWSALIWIGATFTIWSGLAGSGVSAGLAATLLVLIVTNLGMAIPSAPGYVGVYHLLVAFTLQPFGVDEDLAKGAAIVVHALIFGSFIVVGVWFLWRGGYSLGTLRDAAGH